MTTASFYRQTLVCVLFWWTIVWFVTGRPLYQVTNYSVITRPTWLPKSCMLNLQKHRRAVFFGQIASLTAASFLSSALPIRLLTALAFSLYHLAESSMTNRHGEYPIIQIVWALCLPNEKYGHAAAFGIAINFVLATGYAKLYVGGLEWMNPKTMQTYLESYQMSRSRFNQPLNRSLSLQASSRPSFMKAASVFTIAVECALVPATLVLQPEWRISAAYGMIAMHIGIALIMSFKVGVVFATSLSTYLYGFSFSEPFGTGPWFLAAAIGLLPTLASMAVGTSCVIPEIWPLTPNLLFMWSHKTTRALLQLLMKTDTRMVFATRCVAGTGSIVGKRVVHHGDMDYCNHHGNVVHDSVLRSIGFTIAQGGEPLIRAAKAMQVNQLDGAATKKFLQLTQSWLRREKRLVEAQSGEMLTYVYLVRVNGNMEVSEVLSFCSEQ